MTIHTHDDAYEPAHTASQTAHALDELQLYGYRPFDEPDPRPMPDGQRLAVAVGDILKVEKLETEPGGNVSLPVTLVVAGSKVTTDAKELAKVAVTGEVLEHTKGPKIRIHKFKNKTGYHKRQGHRQPLTVLKVTGIK